MKRIFVFLLVLAEFITLFGCGEKETLEPISSSPSVSRMVSDSSPLETNQSAAVCMGSVSHPVHRIVQLGFMEKAEELGYEGHILGLSEGSVQELYDCWLAGAQEHDIAGAVCWVGDDSAYEFLKELHGMEVKTVVPRFPHPYEETKGFIDANIYANKDAMVERAAEFICQTLQKNHIDSGEIGVCVNMHDYSDGVFRKYILYHYPEYKVINSQIVGAEKMDAQKKVTDYIRNNPEMKAILGMTSICSQIISAAKKETGRNDIIVVGYDVWSSLEFISNGSVDACISNPGYEEGYVGMEILDNLLGGRLYNISEEHWRQELPGPLVYSGGIGKENPAYYDELFHRVKTRFVVSETNA